MPRCLVLDLDGTLVNSAPDIAAALNRLMAARDQPPFPLAEVAAMIGDGVAMLLARAFAARGAVPDGLAHAAFMAEYGAHVADATRPYPGVPTTLQALREAGWRLAVCTNKPASLAHAILSACGLDGCFAAVGGGDSFATRKPDPGHLLATIAAAGAEPSHAVMAGDHRNDILAATGAGMSCIFAAWGYGPRRMAEGAAAIAEEFAALPDLAEGLLAPHTAPAATARP